MVSNRIPSHVIAGARCLCSSLKSFFSDRVQGMLCRCNTSSKYKRLNPKLERKEALLNLTLLSHNFEVSQVQRSIKEHQEGTRTQMGTIDHEELKKCLNKLQLHLTEREIEDLFQACDVDGIEGIQLNEFVVLLCLLYLPKDSSDNSHAGPTTISNPISRMGSPELFLQYFLTKQILSVNSGKVSFKEFLFALTNWVGIDADDEKENM
ncbi:hypothetical protein MKW92_043753 [Papaver armeniacum]|nr:hypothetical protein MKW92_043753 [Papaver armeniacum]